MGFQELLIHLHPVFAVLIFPVAAIVGFVALPWIGDDDGPTGIWLLSPAARGAAGIAALAAIAICVAGVAIDEALAPASTTGPGWVVRGVIPTVVLAGIAATVAVVARRRFGLGRNESVQTVFLFLVVMFVTLNVIGVYFRGEGMALTVPWGG
jgi:hypothetical protein